MSPAIKSKSKSSSKSAKEQQQKAASKLLTAPVNGGNSIPGGAYNPISGTFHSLEKASSPPSSAPPGNGRFQTIDEREEHSVSSNGNPEYDSVSNGSCSGDSEDPKEKAAASTKTQREAIPGSDTDKRDKIRQKNEKKHQRQRERRAQELHERCSGYLMSRKLEVLSQQLVAMGFPPEQATTALILNEGRVEESIAWLLEGGEGEQLNAASLDVGSNLKIDIGDELARIADLEAECKCSKQEVERAIVACEGDLEKAGEVLKVQQKQELPVSPSRPGGASGEPAVANGEHKVGTSGQNTIARTQVKPVDLAVAQQERDFNYSKAVAAGAVPLGGGSKGRNLQSPRPQPKVMESSRQQVPPAVEKRWPGATANPSVSIPYSSASPSPLPSPVGVPPAKVEARYAVMGSEAKTNPRAVAAAALKEPVVVMQRPQTNSKLLNLVSSVGLGASPAATTSGWYPSGVSNVETVKVSSVGGLGANLQTLSSATNSAISSAAQFSMSQHQPFVGGSRVDAAPVGWGGGTWNSMGMSSGTSTSASLTVPSSLGLFTGWGSSGSSGSSSPVDWSTGGSMMQCDYASIDWSLDSAPLRPSKADHRNQDWMYDARAMAFAGGKVGRAGINGGVCVAGGLQDGGRAAMDPLPTAGSHEWTSPFAGKDLFSLSRRFVTSPSL